MPDKEKVIKGLTECVTASLERPCPLDCPYFQLCFPDEGPSNPFMSLMQDTLTLLKEQEWNVLTEDAEGVIHGLPGDDGQYLMTDGKDIWIDDYVDGVTDGIILDSGRDIREIRAWMYMPELPKKNRM